MDPELLAILESVPAKGEMPSDLLAILDSVKPRVDLRPQQGEDPAAYRERVKAAAREGFTPTAGHSEPVFERVSNEAQPSVLGDVARAGGAGVLRGAASLVGLPGTLQDLVVGGLNSALESTGLVGELEEPIRSSLSSDALTGYMSSLTGGASDYRGDTVAGRLAGTAGEFIPGAALFGGVSPANLLKYGVIPGVSSEAAGMATEGTAVEPYARIAAALAAPMAAQGLENVGRRIISPYGGADPERLALAAQLTDRGIPVTAGQRVGSEALRKREALTTGGQRIAGEQAEAFTREALKTAGIDATKATPEVLAKAADDIGQTFDDIVRGVDVTPSVAISQSAEDALALSRELSPDKLPPLLSNVNKRIMDAATGGPSIPAATLKQWRSNLSKLTKSPDAATREGAVAMLEAVDDAMAETLRSLGRADDVARLSQARSDWRNFLALEKAATGAGEGAASGVISPSALRGAVKGQGASSYARGGRGDIGELARAGEGVLKALPDSGTGGWMSARGFNPYSMLGAGGAAAGSTMGPMEAIAGALIGAAIPAVGGAVRMSRPVQAYLGNQLVGPGAQMISSRALSPVVAALLGLEDEE